MKRATDDAVQQRNLSPLLACCARWCLISALSLGGCSSPQESQSAEEAQAIDDSSKSLIKTLEDLSLLFETTTPSAEALDKVRAFLKQNEAPLRALVGSLKKRREDANTDSETPSLKGDSVQAAANQTLTRFAQAQQRWRERATEAQKIELSHILRSLR